MRGGFGVRDRRRSGPCTRLGTIVVLSVRIGLWPLGLGEHRRH